MLKRKAKGDVEKNPQTGYNHIDDNLTYEIPGERMTIRCCLCRNPLKKGKGGWCESCQTYPINITPVRFCEQRHRVNPDGWCATCEDYVRSLLEPRDAQWIDTGIIPKRLGKEKVAQLVREITKTLSGPGWPEKMVPLRSDMIPRSWKRQTLRVVGQTPLGYDIVIPESAGIVEEDAVPF